MYDADWLICDNVALMLIHLGILSPTSLPAPEDRRLRLLACAASRRIWHLLDDHCREAIDLAERFADGLAGTDELRAMSSRLEARIEEGGFACNEEEGQDVLAALFACKIPTDAHWRSDVHRM